jgi:tRNA threonylcarbamoyladenosine biosynthesis protein TsaB
MLVLAVETATPVGSVSLVSEQGLIQERGSGTVTTHSIWLLPAIRDMLASARLILEEVDGFAVSSGPGSFTGLRIGLSVVKGLSLATGKPVVAVSTLDAMAELVPFCRHLVCPLLDARKKEVYAALYRFPSRGSVRRDSDNLVLAPSNLAQLIKEKVLFLGNGAQLHRDLLADLLGKNARFASARFRHPKAAAVGQLGLRRLAQAKTDDLDGLEPLYVRPPEAELRRLGRSQRRRRSS